jgi:phosphoserine aminotransferase
MPKELRIPHELLPRDGRFGSGPSRIRDFQLEALRAAQPSVLGTSHRAEPVRNLVGDVRRMLAELYTLPDGYEVLLGLGGASAFWDAAACGLVDARAQHCVFGEFGSKFAASTEAVPRLQAPSVRKADAGGVILPVAEDGIDVYAWPHNETSTGAMAAVTRPVNIGDALTVVDGTSAAGGLALDASQVDVYYFSPQKGFGSDGGLWFAFVSPAAIERIERIHASGRYIPPFLSLKGALDNSRLDQTINTPAVATLVLMQAQLRWMLDNGGMDFATARTQASASHMYTWADASSWANCFVTSIEHRSHVVATIDISEEIDAAQLRQILRSHGVVDIDPYRKLGRNQIRVGMFPAVDPEDVVALTRSLDWLVEALAASSLRG